MCSSAHADRHLFEKFTAPQFFLIFEENRFAVRSERPA
jgi:hypothetical protein